jgi:hypothetical protein
MPLAAYPDLGLLIRTARILPIVAIAAFAGGVVGGFVVFAINGSLRPPRPDLGTSLGTTGHATATAVPAKPVTIVGEPTPNPAVTQPPVAAAPLQTPIQTPAAATSVAPTAQTAQTAVQDEPRPTRWPNALMRGRKVITPLPPAVTPATGDDEEEKSAQTEHKSSGAAASADDDHAAARRHAHAAKKRDRQFSSAAGARQGSDRTYSHIYDYDGTGYRDAGGVASPPYGTQHRRAIRGQRPRWAQPAEVAQPWSGQFWGGGYYRDGQ